MSKDLTARPGPGPLEATMVARAALALLVVTMLCGGCTLFSGSRQQAVQAPAGMPLTEANVCQIRAAVARAKAGAPKPPANATKDDYLRFARIVYVHAWPTGWAPAATTETALAKAKAGDKVAREYLTIMVYDLQLQAAMEGASLSAEDWRDIYVGSGIMTETVFTGYAAMSRGGKVLP